MDKLQVIVQGSFGTTSFIDLDEKRALLKVKQWMKRDDVDEITVKEWKDFAYTCIICWHAKTEEQMDNEDICKDCQF